MSFLDYVIVCSKDDFMLIKDSNDTSIKLKKIHNIIEFYAEYDENLIRYIKGHLFLEYLINTILKKSLNKECGKYTFCEKIRLLYKNNLIDDKEKDLLLSINKLRNKIAHVLDFELSFDELFDIVKMSSKIGVDYSDSTIFNNRKLSKEWYGISGIINELFPNFFSYLLLKNAEYFNDTEIYKYML